MSNEYRENHYVPKWYQKRFSPKNAKTQELYYLRLHPEHLEDSRGVKHLKNPLKLQGYKKCFAEKDLYSVKLGSEISTDIEKKFFGHIDKKGRDAVEFFTQFTHPNINNTAFKNLLLYMGTQKLRTPKGLDWLSSQTNVRDKNTVLKYMLGLRQLYGAIWSECVWLIADASKSNTKFIVSDHPVTVYNRECGPRNRDWCRGSNDPDIRLIGTHTLFPLTYDKILILTNLSWIRNPYQSAKRYRPNPNFFRPAIFNWTNIQIHRFLSEQEVKEINFIIKSRAYNYIGAGKKEWLYPEEYVSKSNWNKFGEGYLLMPDPRSMNFGGETIFGFKDGSADAFDAFGRKPWEAEYNIETDNKTDFRTFYRFKGQFARMYGKKRRGRSFNIGNLDPVEDSDTMHGYHLSLDTKKRKRRNAF